MEELIRRKLAGTRAPNDVLREAADRLRPTLPVDEWIRRRPVRVAAVLVPIMARPTGLTLLLTKRNDELPDHPGQIAFPGGGVEPHDRDAAQTALREAFEEIGLPPERVEVIGFLAPHLTPSGFAIAPIVGLVRVGFDFTLQAKEVAEVFEIPMTFIMDPSSRRSEEREFAGRRLRLPLFEFEGRRIWGATASMLADLQDQLSREAA